jgi:hypothetical protein
LVAAGHWEATVAWRLLAGEVARWLPRGSLDAVYPYIGGARAGNSPECSPSGGDDRTTLLDGGAVLLALAMM